MGRPAESIKRPSSIATFLLLATRTLPIATWLVAKSRTIGSLPLRGMVVQYGLVVKRGSAPPNGATSDL